MHAAHKVPLALLAVAVALFVAGCTASEPQPSASPSPSVSTAALDDRPVQEQLVDAVVSSDTALAALALEAGADPSLYDESTNNSPMSLAITRDDLDMVQLLIDNGAVVEYPEFGYSELFTAASFAGADVAQALLNAGADPNGVGEFLGSPLAQATYEGNLPVVLVLIDAGADPNLVVDNGQRTITALFGAAYSGDVDIVNVLFQAGADPSIRSSDGSSPSEWADLAGHRELAEYLRTAGA